MHAYIHTYTCAYISFVDMHMYVCLSVCMHACMYVCRKSMHVHMYVYRYTHKYTHGHIYIYTYILQLCLCMHVHTRTLFSILTAISNCKTGCRQIASARSTVATTYTVTSHPTSRTALLSSCSYHNQQIEGQTYHPASPSSRP